MAETVLGGCMCGRVRYRAEGDWRNVRVCHCRLCQRAMGTAFHARILYDDYQVAVTGDYATANSSDDLERAFCPACGTALFSHRVSTGWIGVSAGSLDDPSQFRPECHIWVKSKQPWLVIAYNLPQYEEKSPG